MRYNKTLRHLNLEEVKLRHQQKSMERYIEEKINELRNQRQREEIKSIQEKIANKNSPKYSDWRFDLSENMTTQAMTYATTLPAEGETTLADVTSSEYILDTGASVDGSIMVLDSNNIPGSFGNAKAETGLIDLSNYTTLKLNITKRTIGSSEELRLFYRTAAMRSGGPNNWYIMRNDLFNSQTIDLAYAKSVLGNEIEFQLRSFFAGSSTPRDYTTWNVNSFVFQRRTPLTVFVPLDSPEASAFVRTGEFSKLSNEEKIKKLKQMMNASDEYLTNKFGDAFPGTNASQEFEDVQSAPSWEEAAGEQLEPSSPESSTETTKSTVPSLYQGKSAAWMTGAIGASSIESLTDQFRGTNVRVKFLKAQAQEAERASKTIAQLGRRSSSLSNERQIQQAQDRLENAREMIKAEIEGSTPNLKPITQVPKISDDRVELEKNIEASLKQLDIDNEELKGEALKRNIAVAAEIGLDVLTLITLLSPIPGDEVAALSAQGVKVGSKATAKKALEKAVTKSNPSQRVKDFANRIHSSGLPGGQGTIYPGGTGPGSTPLRIYRNSYEPEGEMIVERKLKNPQAFFQDKDIKPEFPENPPPPQIKGLHPDLVTGEKTSQRFNKLDPISAKAMPRTGIKAIDKKVKKAKRLPK